MSIFLCTSKKGYNGDFCRGIPSTRGELLSVDLPDGTLIEYIHDPLGRRIAKKVNGSITEKYLWEGQTRLLAVYDGSDVVQMRFEYADGRMPFKMNKSGTDYYLTYDQVGTLRLVTDVAGNIIKRVDYDTFGNVLLPESNPTFEVPFGFAGGLHDRDTGLVRFGHRDFDPEVRRWTAKDPIFFDGGDTDLYGYVLSDPVNAIDPIGFSAADVAAMNKTFRSTVDKMTSEGKRHPNKDINNISRFINDYISESLGNPYLGCWEQADIVVDALRDIDKDDDWKITREGRYFPPHYWVEAISDNPEDPKIIFDPQDDLIQNFFPHDKSYYDNNNSYTPCD